MKRFLNVFFVNFYLFALSNNKVILFLARNLFWLLFLFWHFRLLQVFLWCDFFLNKNTIYYHILGYVPSSLKKNIIVIILKTVLIYPVFLYKGWHILTTCYCQNLSMFWDSLWTVVASLNTWKTKTSNIRICQCYHSLFTVPSLNIWKTGI